MSFFNKHSKALLSYAVLSVFLLVFALYYMNNKDDFSVLSDVNSKFLIVIALGHVLNIYFQGLLIKLLLRSFNKNITQEEGFYVSMISSIGNFFLPGGSGVAMRAVYLKKKIGFAYKKFIVTVYGNYLILFFSYGIAGLLSLIAIYRVLPINFAYVTLFITFLVMSASSLFLIIYRFPESKVNRLRKQRSRVSTAVLGMIDGWGSINSDKILIKKMVVLTVISFLTGLLINFAAISSLGLSTSFAVLTLFSALGSIALVINITPGALGIRESLYVFSVTLLGFSVPEIITISVVERLMRFIVLVVGFVYIRSRVIFVKDD